MTTIDGQALRSNNVVTSWLLVSEALLASNNEQGEIHLSLRATTVAQQTT